MKSIVPLIALTLACAACAGEPAPERVQTPAASRALAEPAVAASRPDVTIGGSGNTVAPAPRAAEATPAPPDRPSTVSSTPTRPAAAAAPTQPEARRISATELAPLIARGEAILVDVRGESEWSYRRAAGAVHIPYPDLFARSVELPHEKLIALYCT